MTVEKADLAQLFSGQAEPKEERKTGEKIDLVLAYGNESKLPETNELERAEQDFKDLQEFRKSKKSKNKGAIGRPKKDSEHKLSRKVTLCLKESEYKKLQSLKADFPTATDGGLLRMLCLKNKLF